MNDKYKEYLKSFIWRAKRKEVLEYYDYTCEMCGATKNLQVHHKNYNRIWGKEAMEDLTVLCKECHEIWVHGLDGDDELDDGN